jgi:DNA polymerase-1
MKIAMARVHERLRSAGSAARMLLQVHDELVIEVPDSELTAVRELVRETMENAYALRVPLKVDVEAGPDWYNQAPVA